MARLGPPTGDDLRSRLSATGCSPGTFLGLQSPVAAEIAGLAGLEWVVLDLEHGGGTAADVGPTVAAAAGYGVAVIVRVPRPDRAMIGWVADQGAAGIMVPRIESVDEAREVAGFFSYPPEGERGVASYTRAAGWGQKKLTDLPRPVYMPQIETPGALSDVDHIAALPEVDALFIGPLDLSFALGVPGKLSDEGFLNAFRQTVQAGAAHRIPVGSIAPSHERAEVMVADGVNFVALGSDGLWLRQSLGESAEALRNWSQNERAE